MKTSPPRKTTIRPKQPKLTACRRKKTRPKIQRSSTNASKKQRASMALTKAARSLRRLSGRSCRRRRRSAKVQHLAICQSCRFWFALPAFLDGATCPKPGCGGAVLVSDGSYGGAFSVLHQAFPHAMPRSQRREIQKLLRKMVAGKITAEEAIEDDSLSDETRGLLTSLAKLGMPALQLILMLLVILQTQWNHDENRRDQAQANEDQRALLETLAGNLEHLHENDGALAARLARAGEARIVEIEAEQGPSPPRRQAESASGPKRQSPEPKATRKAKKAKRK